ncbi:hypothetical protein Emag_000808 [Eimeria magna]
MSRQQNIPLYEQNASLDGIGHRVEAVLPAAATPRVLLIPEVGQQPAQYDAAAGSPHGKLRVGKNSDENVAQEVAHRILKQQQQSPQLEALDRPKRREQQHQQVLLQDATRFCEQQIPAGAQETAKQPRLPSFGSYVQRDRRRKHLCESPLASSGGSTS